ncbi:MAG TPA: D-aminoacyl-tRNA deacylase [Tepidiformaceae bacterium]|nr:D-aminoacyl-tRNA deacylase [Tepidiformaceae bacterium]
MRAVVQRVRSASVTAGDDEVARIGLGLLVLLGVSNGDTPADADRLAAKVALLRIFDDADGRMNVDVSAAQGAVLCVSQFTLYGDVRRGNRPSYSAAAPRPVSEPLYQRFCEAIDRQDIRCERGVFGAEMLVRLENDGPVTLIIDTSDLDTPRRA